MSRWIPVLMLSVTPFLGRCSEKKEVVPVTESSTVSPATNPSPATLPPGPIPVPPATQTSATPPIVTAPSAGPPLRNPATEAPAPDVIDSARRISLRDAELLVSSGEAVVVDVRSEADFAKSHVRGAINIPVSQVLARASELPRDKMIITYCT